MRKIYLIATLAILTLLCGCSQSVEIIDSETVAAKSELSIGLPINISRTAIDDTGKASWTENDSFILWAQNRAGGFNIVEAEFKMMYYWQSYQSAVFTANTNTISEGTYTYYAISPTPEIIDNQKATYTLPNEQQGDTFNPAYDVLVATPLQAEAIIPGKVNNLALDFQHKMHLLKMTIPQGGNPLKGPISRVVFTFPTAVAGNFTINALDPAEAPVINRGSKQLIINIPNGFDEGDHAWGVILPGNISGTVKYYAVSTTGERTGERTFKVSKAFAGGHITPLSLTIPDPIPPTVLRFSVGKNNLGEAVQKVTILDHNRNILKTFTANSANIYDIEQYGLYEEGIFSTYAGKTFTMQFESQHAIVEQQFAMPSTITKYEVNNIATVDVPYLLFEDFSQSKTSVHDDNYNGSGDSDRNLTGYSLNNYMTILGWNAARYNLNAGNGIRINVRYQSGSWVPERASGRLDTPALSALKPGATVKLKVSFDTAFYIPSGYNYDDSSSNDKAYFTLGTHTNQSAAINSVLQGDINGVCTVIHTSNTFASTLSSNSFGAEMPTYSVTIPTATASTRIVWFACTHRNSSHIAANCCYYMYLDNIKVSIAQ
ncbi:MAG: hypothetical protein E7129_02785 [Rikenellaceae bacterium]|nr:hypothetical protein [Rikenellaceae bacterium]